MQPVVTPCDGYSPWTCSDLLADFRLDAAERARMDCSYAKYAPFYVKRITRGSWPSILAVAQFQEETSSDGASRWDTPSAPTRNAATGLATSHSLARRRCARLR